MKLCSGCGRQLQDSDRYCPACGENQSLPAESFPPDTAASFDQSAAAAISSEELFRQAKKQLHIPRFFVWSLFLVLAVNPFGTLIGMIAGLLAITANAAGKRPEEAADDVSLCKKLCVLATIIDLAFFGFLGTMALFSAHP